jgi:hypothetical protein
VNPRTCRALVAAAAVVAVTLSACGSTESPEPAAEVAEVAEAASATAESASSATSSGTQAGDGGSDPGLRPNLPVENEDSPLPAVTVRDVVDDRWVQFADILPAEQPVLLWFWAPF